jgi:Integrase core domain
MSDPFEGKIGSALLEALYQDPKLAINSSEKLYNEAKKVMHARGELAINKKEVRDWYNTRSVNQTRGYRKDNSWVANLPREEFQVDIAYMTWLPKEHRGPWDYAFICIDVFSKKANVVGMQKRDNKQATDAMRDCFKKMGSPSYVYSDKGGEFTNQSFKDELEANGSEQVFTNSHANFAERFISGFLKTYNKDVRPATGFSPNEASEDRNSADVRASLLLNAKRDRKYPPLQVGDMVRYRDKRGGGYTSRKVTTSKWSDDKHPITSMESSLGMMHYKVNGNSYLRHELLKA